MPNRDNGPNSYRYKYQGQEKDIETGMEAFELRLWDSRIGRWLTTDPVGQFSSPYLGMGNNPISLTDPDGGCVGKDCPWYWKLYNSAFGIGRSNNELTNDLGVTNYSEEKITEMARNDMIEGVIGLTEAVIPDAGELNLQLTVPLSMPGTAFPYQNITLGGSLFIDSYGNIGINGNYGVEFTAIPSLDIGLDVSAIYALEPGKKLHLNNFAGSENNFDLSLPTPYVFDANASYFNSESYYGISLGASVGLSRYSRSLQNSYFSYSKTIANNPFQINN